MLHDLLIAGVVTGGKDHALGSVELDVLIAVLCIADDHAGHAAVAVLEQLGAKAAVEGLGTGLDGLVQVGFHHKALLILAGGAEFHAGGEGGELFVAVVVVLGLRPCQRHQNALVELLLRDHLTGGVADGQLRISLDEPIHDLVCMAGPLFQDGALVAEGALAHQAVDHHILVHNVLAAPALVQAAVQQSVLAAAAVEGGALLHNSDLCALLGGGAGSADAGQTGTDDDHIKVLRLGSLHIRLLTQPVLAGISSLLCGRGLGLYAHGLLDAAGGSFLDGVGGDGSAGDVVDFGILCFHQRLLQGGGSHAADALGLVGGIHHHIGDSSGAEGHGHLHLADAGSSAGVGAGGVDSVCYAAGRSAAAVAGSQSACGDAAHGGGSGNLQKALTRDLFHLVSPFLCSFFFRVCGIFCPCPQIV